MSDPNAYTLTGLGALLILNVGQWLRIVYESKKTNNKNENKPGSHEICIERGTKIALIENDIKHINNSLTSIDGKLENIDKGINGKK